MPDEGDALNTLSKYETPRTAPGGLLPHRLTRPNPAVRFAFLVSYPTQPAMLPEGSQLSGVLAVTEVDDRLTVPPKLKMPPP